MSDPFEPTIADNAFAKMPNKTPETTCWYCGKPLTPDHNPAECYWAAKLEREHKGLNDE